MMRPIILLSVVIITVLLFIGSVTVSAAFEPLPVRTSKPIIGILTLPCTPQPRPQGPIKYCDPNTNANSYFTASYVKILESAGARVMPILYNSSHSELNYTLSRLNGVLLTGGSADLDSISPYAASVSYIVNWILSINQQGQYYPLLGICLGYQAIVYSISGRNEAIIQPGYDSYNYTIPLNFTSAAMKNQLFSTELYGSQSETMYQYLSILPITSNMHHWAVSITDFINNPILNSLFTILATNTDRVGREFVSLITANNNIPILGFQFHPEKVAYEFDPNTDLSHTFESIQANHYLLSVFVQLTRQNTNTFYPLIEPNLPLIYHYTPIYVNVDFEQVYQF